MKKALIFSMIVGVVVGSFAADTIYRGKSQNPKDVICYYMGGRFYSDAARKQALYHHPGNMVSKGAKATPKNSIYRLMGDKIYKGFSVAKPDCIATIFETKTSSKGYTLEAKVYEGFVVVRDVVKNYDKKTKTDTVTKFKVTGDGVNPVQGKVLFTIADNKIYRGDSKKDADCLLNYTGNFSAGRLLFMAIELTK